MTKPRLNKSILDAGWSTFTGLVSVKAAWAGRTVIFPRYSVIDEAAFKSKNLYNAALYEIRKTFFNEGMYLTYEEIHRRMQAHEAYKALPAKVSQQILRTSGTISA